MKRSEFSYQLPGGISPENFVNWDEIQKILLQTGFFEGGTDIYVMTTSIIRCLGSETMHEIHDKCLDYIWKRVKENYGKFRTKN